MADVVATPARPRTRGGLQTFSSLSNRYFALFWSGNIIAMTGMQMQMIAQAWLVLQLTDSAFYLGLVNASSSVSVLFLSALGGVAADRLQKRNLLLFTQFGMMLISFAIGTLIATGVIQIWEVVVGALLGGALMSFNGPARQSYVAELVGREHLMNAVALNSAGMNMTRIIGPSMGGLLITAVGVAGSFFFRGFAYILVMASLLVIPLKGSISSGVKKSMWADLVEGLTYVRRNRIMLTLLLVAAIPAVLGSSYQILMPIFARDVFHTDATGLGILMGATGVGALSGSLIVASLGNTKIKGLLMLIGAFMFGVMQIAFSLSPIFVLSLFLLVLLGMASTIYMATNNTLIQALVPDELRGRVMSLMMLTWGLTPLGSVPAGAIATATGAPFAVALSGTLVVAYVLFVAVTQPAVKQLA